MSPLSNDKWRASDRELFFSRKDADDPRLGDLVQALSIDRIENSFADQTSRHFTVAGYPDDEGIGINGGRAGAKSAPSTIRKYLYKMTPALQESANFKLYDLGDVDPSKSELADRHDQGSHAIAAVLEAGGSWISFGGGHDYGFADTNGFVNWVKDAGQKAGKSASQRPLVINFDAHFDVRPTSKGLSSGTPFFRLLETHPEVDFAEIGIQAQCNSKKHLEWLTARGARVLTMEDLEASGQPMVTAGLSLLEDWILKPRPTFISVDIDAFSSAVAPGCSQSWATGFMPQDFFPLFDVLLKRCDVRGLGIYEVSPGLDQDDRTSKLAALIAHRMISRGGCLP